MQEATGQKYEHMAFTKTFRGTDYVIFAQDIVFVKKSMAMKLPVT